MSQRVDFIRQNPHLSNGEICKELDISEKMLYAIKYWNDLNGKLWTDEQEQWLRENYSDADYEEMSRKLGRSIKSVQMKALRLGLER